MKIGRIILLILGIIFLILGFLPYASMFYSLYHPSAPILFGMPTFMAILTGTSFIWIILGFACIIYLLKTWFARNRHHFD